MSWLIRSAALAILLLASTTAKAADTETQYLSGLGKDDPVPWQIQCDNGQHAQQWSTIGVPSNWELQGFGIYTYGRVTPQGGWPRVHCTYKRSFTTAAAWRGKAIFLHFEGVMTDTRVTLNGQSAGPPHQGGYYAFKYNVTSLLKAAGQLNEMEVDVDDESANESVNRAERRGDFWNYGGIFRPVFLEAVPKTYIDHLAINATASGTLDVNARLFDLRDGTQSSPAASIEMQVLETSGRPVGAPVTMKDVGFKEEAHLAGKIVNPRLWTAETPNLYQLQVQLKLGHTVVHTVRQRFGFRTVELRPGKGLFVNGHRVFVKGFARHSFWPDSGRTLSDQISKDDIHLMKEMNANAVRSSHYPPDGHFLENCDELGLYVFDELTGWQAKYDTEVGRKLVREMVEHDVNHPSILFWDNGNEGGFNFDLDGDYARYDPQKRTVLHPWAAYPPGVADTKHYLTYDTLQSKLAQDPVLIPTEMLHGLYDGGAGAGLEDYWNTILRSKAGGGGIIWSFVDEDIKRVDEGGVLDSQGNYAPDGVVGPYREREASFYAVKQIWSPIVVTPNAGKVRSYTVSNRYGFLDANQCSFEWQRIAFHRPNDAESGSVVLSSQIDHGRSLAPGASATWDSWGPLIAASGESNPKKIDAKRLIIRDATGLVLRTYVWPVDDLELSVQQGIQSSALSKPAVVEAVDTLHATAGDLTLEISKTTGLLVSASRQGQSFSLAGGPRVLAMEPRRAPPPRQAPQAPAPSPLPLPATAPESKLISLTHSMEGNDLIIYATFDGPMKSLRYQLKPSGWLSINYRYAVTGPHEYFGVGFDYPEAKVKGVRFLGDGPEPVYKNRLAGTQLDVWEKRYNNTMVGDPDDLKPGEHFNYPMFKGFYSGVRWVQLNTSEGPITAVIKQSQDPEVYLHLFTPKVPPPNLLGQVAVPFPAAGISFLNGIPAIGNKFGGPQTMGPSGQEAIAQGEYNGEISLYFGKLPSQ